MENSTDSERRGRQPAVPPHLDRYLNEMQMQTLAHTENFGWELYFVRRPIFEPVLAILRHHDKTRLALLTETGELEIDPEITLRH